jgi:hypothetical protein
MSAADILVPFIKKYGPIGTVRVVTYYVQERGRSLKRGFILARAELRLTRKQTLHHKCCSERNMDELCPRKSDAEAMARAVAEREGRVIISNWSTGVVVRDVANLETLGWYARHIKERGYAVDH